MTCKDCIHYDVCKCVNSKVDEMYGNRNGTQYGCGYFKDKARFIELPKTMWVISECLELEEYEVLGVFTTNNSIWLDAKGNKQQLLMQISNYNKTWFTNKAKAEAKLKELNNENA